VPAVAQGETPARTYAKTALLIPQTYFRCLFMTIQSRCNHAPNDSIVRRGRREQNAWSSRIDGDTRHSFVRSPNRCPCSQGDGHVWLTACRSAASPPPSRHFDSTRCRCGGIVSCNGLFDSAWGKVRGPCRHQISKDLRRGTTTAACLFQRRQIPSSQSDTEVRSTRKCPRCTRRHCRDTAVPPGCIPAAKLGRSLHRPDNRRARRPYPAHPSLRPTRRPRADTGRSSKCRCLARELELRSLSSSLIHRRQLLDPLHSLPPPSKQSAASRTAFALALAYQDCITAPRSRAHDNVIAITLQ
jgi:hypothetical protein